MSNGVENYFPGLWDMGISDAISDAIFCVLHGGGGGEVLKLLRLKFCYQNHILAHFGTALSKSTVSASTYFLTKVL